MKKTGTMQSRGGGWLRTALLTAGLLISASAFAGGGRNRVVGSEAQMTPVRAPVTVDGDLGEWDASQGKLLTLFSGGGEDSKSEVPLEKFSAKITFQYDQDALYVAVWWNDPTPLGPETSPGCTPPGDGLILSLPLKAMTHVACWREPDGTEYRAVMSGGDTPLAKGAALQGATQGCKVTGKHTYTQELRIPWSDLGGRLEPGAVARLGVELCFGGLDPAAGYKAWQRDSLAGISSDGNRWGGNMGWGFVDGLRSTELLAPSFDPATGAEVKLMPAGSVAPANPAVMYNGNEHTRTTAMIAVPAHGITVDGKLDAAEWDAKSATAVASEPTLFPNRYAVDVHWAYDEKGLYAGLRWRTGGPHLNINDPAVIDHGYDGGDAIQIRLGTDRVTHVDAWYCDATKTPCVGLFYGAKFNEGSERDATTKGALLAIQPLDNGGYTEEIFLPWALITKTGAPLKTGDAFRVVLDVFFSGLEGNRIPFIVNTRVAEPTGVVALPFTAPADGFYTVVIDSAAEGRAIRRLLSRVKLAKGQVVAEWDGLDDQGQSVPAGDYRFRGLRHTGIGLKYLMTYNNPGNPPWQNDSGTGEWGGDHSPPQAVAADNDGVYLAWGSAEDGSGVIGCGLDGQRRWGFFQLPTIQSDCASAFVAADGGKLYYASETRVTNPPADATPALAHFETAIACLDTANGFRTGMSLKAPCTRISTHNTTQTQVGWWWDLWQKKNFSFDTCGIRDDLYFSGHCAGGNLAGLAARDGRLYVSLRVPGEVAVYSSADMKELARWTLAKPAGLAFAKDGALFAVSGATVVRLDLASGAATPVVTAGLEAPVGLAVDNGGVLYVSDWGGAQCVKVFDATGKLQRTIGTPGGRNWVGAYDPNGMLMPRGLAIDKNGRLWVAENDQQPGRNSVWEAKTGKFVREFVGNTVYGAVNGGMIDPKDPGRAISAGVWFGIDLGKEGYRPLTTAWRRLARDEIFEFNPIYLNQTPSTRFVECNGRRFIVCADARCVKIGELRADGAWRPLAAVGGIFNRGDNPEVVPENKLSWQQGLAPAFFAKHAGENYVWTDLNGDGAAQEEEFQWRRQDPKTFPCWGAYWGSGMVDNGMNIVIGGMNIGGGNALIAKFPLQGWTDGGAPKYDIQKCELVRTPNEHIMSVCVARDGAVLDVCHAEARRWGCKNTGLYCHAPDGKLRWMFPTSEDPRPMGSICGEGLMGPVDAGGETGEIIGLTQWHGCHVPLVTTDGLFVDRLLRDPAEGGEPGPDMYRGETVQYLNRLDDGRVILAHGKTAHHLMQVTGLETVRRFAGAFTLTPEQAKLAAERLRTRQEKTEAATPIRITWPANAKDAPAKPTAIDGNLDDWDWTTAGTIGPKTGAPRAEVALRLAAPDQGGSFKEMHLAFKVFKNGPFLNTGKDDPTKLFLTGDAVDLHFSTDPAALPRQAPGLGDCRLLFSKFDGKPIAVLYRAQVPNAKNPKGFSSPTRTVTFDEVAVLSGATVAITDTPDGYVVEAAVPLNVVAGDAPAGLWPGRLVPGDAGIIVADKTGRRVARLYRFNQNTQVVSDVPTEAALYPDQWGMLRVDQEAGE
jgi:hypothetical protein